MNPTPIEQLYPKKVNPESKPKANSKRKLSDLEDLHDVNGSGEQHRKKGRNGHEQAQSSDQDDSFLRGVEARIQAKEEKKQARMEKKRKRRSDTSTNGGSKGPKNKKQKQKHESKPIAKNLEIRGQNQITKRAIVDPPANGTHNGQLNKKQKKSKN